MLSVIVIVIIIILFAGVIYFLLRPKSPKKVGVGDGSFTINQCPFWSGNQYSPIDMPTSADGAGISNLINGILQPQIKGAISSLKGSHDSISVSIANSTSAYSYNVFRLDNLISGLNLADAHPGNTKILYQLQPFPFNPKAPAGSVQNVYAAIPLSISVIAHADVRALESNWSDTTIFVSACLTAYLTLEIACPNASTTQVKQVSLNAIIPSSINIDFNNDSLRHLIETVSYFVDVKALIRSAILDNMTSMLSLVNSTLNGAMPLALPLALCSFIPGNPTITSGNVTYSSLYGYRFNTLPQPDVTSEQFGKCVLGCNGTPECQTACVDIIESVPQNLQDCAATEAKLGRSIYEHVDRYIAPGYGYQQACYTSDMTDTAKGADAHLTPDPSDKFTIWQSTTSINPGYPAAGIPPYVIANGVQSTFVDVNSPQDFNAGGGILDAMVECETRNKATPGSCKSVTCSSSDIQGSPYGENNECWVSSQGDPTKDIVQNAYMVTIYKVQA